MAALAAKYCAVTALSRPTPPSATSQRHMRTMYPRSSVGMPLSMIAATISGTISSKDASSSLNSGPSTHSRPKPFIYTKSFFKIIRLPCRAFPFLRRYPAAAGQRLLYRVCPEFSTAGGEQR